MPRRQRFERDVNGHVAEQDDTVLVRVVAQGPPLAEKQELDDLDVADSVGFLLLDPGERTGIAMHELRPPLGPRPFSMTGLQDAKEGVVVQPLIVILLDEPFEIAQEFVADLVLESIRCEVQEAVLDRNQRAVIDMTLRQRRQFIDLAAVQQAQTNQIADVDQHLVARKSR